MFSLGGYAAGPVVLAALWKRLPLVVMEPNAMPGLTNRKIGRFVPPRAVEFPRCRALLSPREIGNHGPAGAARIFRDSRRSRAKRSSPF